MGKKALRPEQKMFDAGAIELPPEKRIEQARKWALALWDRIAAAGDQNQESAMHQAARLAKVTPSTLWGFRYRPPKKLDVAAYFSIAAAYERYVASVEADIAENLLVLRSLPSNPRRDRLVAQMEEYLRDTEGDETGVVAHRAAEITDTDFDQSRWGR